MYYYLFWTLQANQKNFTALDLVKRMQRYSVLKNTSQEKILTKIYGILMYLSGTYEMLLNHLDYSKKYEMDTQDSL